MEYEYEARFCDLDIEAVRTALRDAGAELAFARTLHRRVVFENEQIRASRSWLRLRARDGHATLTLKRAAGDAPSLDSIRELEIAVSDFDACRELLQAIGLEPVRYQESYREEWRLDGVIYDIDEWPGLPVFLEVEGPSPAAVQSAAGQLGLDFAAASFGSVDELYKERLGRDILAEPVLIFGDEPV
jgi:adenylate cyclase class 2